MISIIIPVFNLEKYLNESLNSVLNQTYANIEVLCIDDCSTDNSSNIIHNFAKTDKRIHYFKMDKNVGAGECRNFGIEKAKGDFIFFLDGDDLIYEKNSLRNLHDTALKYNLDAAGGNLNIFNNEEKYIIPNIFWEKIIFKENGIQDYSSYVFPAGYYRFIYKKAIIKKYNIKFPRYRRRQDPVFFVQIMSKIKRFYASTDYVYSYRIEHKKLTFKDTTIEDILNSFYDNTKIYLKEKLYEHMFLELYELEKNYLNILEFKNYKNIPQYLNNLNAIVPLDKFKPQFILDFFSKDELIAYNQISKKIEELEDNTKITLYGLGKLGNIIYKKYYRRINLIIDNNHTGQINHKIIGASKNILIEKEAKITEHSTIVITILNSLVISDIVKKNSNSNLIYYKEHNLKRKYHGKS